MWLLWIVLVLLELDTSSAYSTAYRNQNQNTDSDLLFLVENGNMEAVFGIRENLISLILPLNATETERRNPFVKMKVISDNWFNYPAFQGNDTPLANEFHNSLLTSNELLGKAGNNMLYMFKFLDKPPKTVDVSSNCQLVVNLVNLNQMDSEAEQLVKLQGKIKAAEIADATDIMINRYYEFISLYSQTAHKWEKATSELVEIWTLLQKGKLSEDLISSVDFKPCFTTQPLEEIHVLNCGVDNKVKALNCELESFQSKQSKPYQKLLPVLYNKVHVATPEYGQIFVMEPDTNAVKTLNCQPKTNWKNEQLNICGLVENYGECESALTMKQVDLALSYCFFKFVKPEDDYSFYRLEDDSLLFTQAGQLTVDNRPTQEFPPLRVYFGDKVVMAIQGEEIEFLSGNPFQTKRIIVSKLTTFQRNRMSIMAYNNFLKEQIRLWDWLDITVLLLELITLPLVFVSLFCQCCNCCGCGKKGRKMKERERNNRRRNFAEGRELLYNSSNRKRV
jgi:hypothetical protein